MKYTFLRRTNDLPDGVDRKRSFDATSYIEALQSASDYWFMGARVIDYVNDGLVVTLLSNAPSGNVIGTLMDYS